MTAAKVVVPARKSCIDDVKLEVVMLIATRDLVLSRSTPLVPFSTGVCVDDDLWARRVFDQNSIPASG